NNVCCTAVCAPDECGDVPKCGVFIPCGTCPDGQVCHNTTCCTPDPTTTTCAGRCGSVVDNCGQQVECPLSCDDAHDCGDTHCVACTALGSICSSTDECCQAEATFCRSAGNGENTYCCREIGGDCSIHSEVQCCGDLGCEESKCCVFRGNEGCTEEAGGCC